jgi:uncharacterized protein YaaQ
MKLVMAIVKRDDSKTLIRELMEKGFQVTRLASSGGFLRTANLTIICVTQDERVDECLSIIERSCKATRIPMSNLTPESSSFFIAGMGIRREGEVLFGGATVFVLNVERMVKY